MAAFTTRWRWAFNIAWIILWIVVFFLNINVEGSKVGLLVMGGFIVAATLIWWRTEGEQLEGK